MSVDLATRLASRPISEVQFLQTSSADSTIRHCRDMLIFIVLHHPQRRRPLASRHLLPVQHAKQRHFPV